MFSLCEVSHIFLASVFSSIHVTQFNRELRRLWEKYYLYPGSSVNNVRLQIGTSSNKSLCQLFVKKKSPKKMLTNVTLPTDRTMNIIISLILMRCEAQHLFFK